MVPLNKNKIADRINNVSRLRKELKLAIENEQKTYGRQLLIERCVQLIIQSIIDIGTHILVKKYNKSPKTYGNVIPLLVEEKFISKELGEKLKKVTALRNVLVHDYFEIEENLLETHGNNLLTDSEEFIEQIKDKLTPK